MIMKQSQKSGFTLMEVVLAIMVVALGVMSAFAMIPNALRMGTDAQEAVRASMVGNSLMNTFRSRTFETTFDWNNVTVADFTDVDYNPPGALPSPPTPYPLTLAPVGFSNTNTIEATALTVSAYANNAVGLPISMKLMAPGYVDGNSTPRPGYAFTYLASFVPVGDVVKMKLELWGNEFKAGKKYSFYTEIHRSEVPTP